VTELLTCPDCKLQFTGRYYREIHAPCPDGIGASNSSEDATIVEVRSLKYLTKVDSYRRNWNHNTTQEKTEEWLVWVGIVSLAAAIAFVFFGR